MNQANKQEARVALVTGGARRIGMAVVKRLHEAGFKVAIHCHYSLNEALSLASDLNQRRKDSALVVQKELIEFDSVAHIIKTTIDWSGRLDVLVNNASLFTRTDCHSSSLEDWDALFQINLKIPFALSLAARPLLAQHQGVIINITDIHAQRPLKGYAVYCQSKAALEMQTKALACEFAPQIRVNAIAPGAIAWPEGSNSLSAEAQEQIITKTPLKQHGQPEYIAHAVFSLIENPFITGQILNVDGGRGLGN